MIHRSPKDPFVPIEKFWPLPTDDLIGAKKKEEEEGNRLGEKMRRFKQSTKYKNG